MTALVHGFDQAPDTDADALRRLLGGKGASLVAMTRAGLPVPPGFTVTTDACRRFLESGWTAELEDAVRTALARLETQTGKRFGDPAAPLLVSVRSGAEVSMPGMMDTVLDVGMGSEVEQGLARLAGDAHFAADTHRRALVSFASVVSRCPAEVVARAQGAASVAEASRVLADAGFTMPADPAVQVLDAIRAVFESWTSPRAARYREVEGIDDTLGTAATVQAMVFGNLGERSGTGVAFTRDPSSGERGLMGDFLPGAQGEDVVAGGHATLALAEMRASWPEQYAELERIAGVLELTMADMVDLEFTVEQGQLWMLQARRGKRSPIAAFRCAIDMAEDPDFPVDRAEAVRRCERYLDDPPTVARPTDTADTTEIARGLAASPGRATGVLCLDPDRAVELEAQGRPVVLVRRETSPADVHGMAASVGLFTLLGGLVSHAAVVARDWGIPAVVGAAEATITDEGLVGPGGFVAAGDVVTVDGDQGVLLVGGEQSGSEPAPEVEVIRAWAAELDTARRPTSPTGDAVSFPVLHALRIKGMATAATLAAMGDLAEAEVVAALEEMAQEGLAVHLDARDMWRLSPEGRDAHAPALAAASTTLDLDNLPYGAFLELNDEFKELCTDWQIRQGEPNDHQDPDYDDSVLHRLADLDDRAQPIAAAIASIVPWTAPYAPRLAAARARVESGDTKAFTGVMCDSYHDVWMELHEDLILTQGIDRAAEGSG